MQLGALSKIAAGIEARGKAFNQNDLETALAFLYEPIYLATMVLYRYPAAPHIMSYETIIREAIEAHFLGLDHIAAGGLIPVIEGAGRLLASQRRINCDHVKDVFAALALDCKTESATNRLGAPDEVAAMMDSFLEFIRNGFYAKSNLYPFSDGTNRHGIAHGAYTDADYGTPINFYKTIAAVDFLTFVSSFKAHISWLAPSPTPDSLRLAAYFRGLFPLRTALKPQLVGRSA